MLFYFCAFFATIKYRKDGTCKMAYFDTGERIKEIRKSRNLNQDQLAELASLNRVTIAKYESGRVEPGAQALSRIADALEVSTDVLLGRTDEDMRQDIQEKLVPNIPKTAEARAVSAGMDELPPEQRQLIVNMVTAMYPDVFKKTKGITDDEPKL